MAIAVIVVQLVANVLLLASLAACLAQSARQDAAAAAATPTPAESRLERPARTRRVPRQIDLREAIP